MKLVLCQQCGDIFPLRYQRETTCECGLCSGYYIDELYANIFGPCTSIGFTTSEFESALRNIPENGMGVKFTAFVIPKICPTITHEQASKRTKPKKARRVNINPMPLAQALEQVNKLRLPDR